MYFGLIFGAVGALLLVFLFPSVFEDSDTEREEKEAKMFFAWHFLIFWCLVYSSNGDIDTWNHIFSIAHYITALMYVPFAPASRNPATTKLFYM